MEVLETVYNDWKAHLEIFEKQKHLPPEEGWLTKFDSSQVNLLKNEECVARDLGLQAI